MQTTRVRVSLLKNDLNLMLTLIWPWPWCVTLTLLCGLDLSMAYKGIIIFFAHDLNLDPMTLILKLDLDMVKMYLHTKMKFLCEAVQKL